MSGRTRRSTTTKSTESKTKKTVKKPAAKTEPEPKAAEVKKPGPSTRTRTHVARTPVRIPLTSEKKRELEERLTKKRKAEEAGVGEGEPKAKRPRREYKPKEVEVNWSGWKDIYLVGTEWDQYDNVFKFDWDFDHLEDMLNDPEFAPGMNVYLFGATEHHGTLAQLARVTKDADREELVHIPVIVAVVSSMPPPATLGIKSVQMLEEMIVPMSSMKMSWVPFVPRQAPKEEEDEEGKKMKKKKKTEAKGEVPLPKKVFYLHCKTRRSALHRMKEEEVKKYEYCMPYLPALEVEDDNNAVVNIVTSIGGRGLTFEYDWELDDLEEFVEEMAKSEGLKEKQQQELKETIKSEVKAAKLARKEEKQKKLEEIAAIPETQKEAIRTMRLLKFYPQNEEPVIDEKKHRSKFINRYYGSAHEVH